MSKIKFKFFNNQSAALKTALLEAIHSEESYCQAFISNYPPYNILKGFEDDYNNAKKRIEDWKQILSKFS